MADRGTYRVVTQHSHTARPQGWLQVLALLRPGPQFVATDFGQPLTRLVAGDPALAFEMYAGHFNLAGETVNATALDVFTNRSASLAWQTALHSLSWLQHFAASPRHLHAHYAMRLLGRWAQVGRGTRDVSTLAKIILALAIDGPVLAQSCGAIVQREFFQLLTRHTRALLRGAPKTPHAALFKSIALLHVATGFRGMEGLHKPALELFSSTIDKLILPDGGPVSRNPHDVIVLLSLLMPLKLAMKKARSHFPAAASNAIERMVPFLALLTHGDGGLAGFADNTRHSAAIAAIMMADDTKAQPLAVARQSHYARLHATKADVLIDTQSGFEFEFSSGSQRLLTSHSAGRAGLGAAQLQQTAQGGVVHISLPHGAARTYFLSAAGDDLRIEDTGQRVIEITLQLEPDVKLTALREATGILLVTPDRELWQLSWRGGAAHVEQNGGLIKMRSFDGERLNWALKKQTKATKPNARKRGHGPDLLT